MEEFRHFLESSTIHGLQYISSTKKFYRLLWICVVFAGFSGACFMIYTSFQSWKDNPIATTIETKPMSEIKFPRVIVCPPKDTYTNLNVDLNKAEKITLDKDTRKAFLDYALEVLQKYYFNQKMSEMKKVQEKKRFFNWYNGFSEICFPDIFDKNCFVVEEDQIYNKMSTSALTGSITLENFEEDINEIDHDNSVLAVQLCLNLPKLQGNPRCSYVDKNDKVQSICTLDLSYEIDKGSSFEMEFNGKTIEMEESTQYNRSIPIIKPDDLPMITFRRQLNEDEAVTPKLTLNWKLKIDNNPKPLPLYNDEKTKLFIR